MRFLFLCLSLLGYLITFAVNADDIPVSALLQRIEMMESRHREEIDILTKTVLKAEWKHVEEIAKLNLDIVKLKDDMASAEMSHKEAISQLNEAVVELTSKVERENIQISTFEKNKQLHTNDDVIKVLQEKQQKQEELVVGETKIMSDKEELIAPKRALRYEGTDIAFTAFLDHDIDNIGRDQVIVFDKILLNDGNGYNQNTGVFTVPVSGVYHFDFFIGERDVNQLYVHLVVNNVVQIDAVTESIQTYHDTQGGNAANLKVVQGDVVYIKHNNIDSGSHIEGSGDVRISSFSGFLLYPVESTPIVGK